MIDRPEQKTRRQVVAGAGAVGALAVGATLLPKTEAQGDTVADAKAGAAKTPGYRESAHVLRYYETARI